ncbi:DegT/DnrJ/EryC1/StrS aminotransferase family protein [Pelagibacterales bacterium SAG-MED35]|nr:DegT/DnrJ/EryC1/StrS aminotransferase family protein [Pelagibacterales bacterium SAG-MED35]
MRKIKLASETIDKKELIALSNWIKTVPKLTMGYKTEQFEKKWSKWVGMKYSVFLNSGSSAILGTFQTLKEMKILKNNKVIIPAICWSTDFSSLTALGYKTVVCDCNLNDLSVSVDELEKLIKKYNPSCLLLVSVLGLSPNMKAITKLCKKHKVMLIEDTCESLGSEFNKKKLGTYGFCSFFSFYYGHHISTIEGGMVSTNNRDFYNCLISVRSHGWSRNMEKKYENKLMKKHKISKFSSNFTFYYRGFNLRPTDVQAFLGMLQMKKIKKIIKKRYQNFIFFRNSIKKKMWKPNINKSSIISNMGYPIISKDKNKIIKRLDQKKIECRPIVSGSLKRQPFFRNHSLNKNKLPNAEIVHKYGFYLPNHYFISKTDIRRMIKEIES